MGVALVAWLVTPLTEPRANGPQYVVIAAARAAFAVLFVAQWRFQTRVLARGTGLPAAFPHPERLLRVSQSRYTRAQEVSHP